MKTTSAIALMLLFHPATFVLAQDFRETLRKTVLDFESATTLPAKVAASNKLDLIVNKFSDQWAAPYYAAYSKAVLAYMEPDRAKKDQYVDRADAYLAQAQKLAPENDEVYVLAAMVANSRLSVDPENRWQKYGSIFSENLEKAKKLRSDNPRIHYLQGTSTFYTPEAFGGGKKAARPHFEKAETLFAQETGQDILKPFWGKEVNAYYLSQCR